MEILDDRLEFAAMAAVILRPKMTLRLVGRPIVRFASSSRSSSASRAAR